MAKKVKFGIVGVGGIWKGAHVKPLTEHEDVEIVAICDVDSTKLERWSTDLGVTRTFTDYRELLKLDEIDAIDICTPNKFHSEIAVAALEAGKHVFTEKPDAINAAEAKRMLYAAKASGKTLMAMRNNRFRGDSQFVKKYIDAGHMGQIYAGRCGWIRRRGIPGKGGWFTTKELSGGGPLIDLGVHMIDLAIWLMGDRVPVAVSGATFTKFADKDAGMDSDHAKFGQAKSGGTFDVEDLAMGMVRFDNGAVLQIEFSWASNIEQEKNFVELRGEHAGVCLNDREPLKLFTEIEGVLCDVQPNIPKTGWGGHAAHLHHFVDVLQGRAEPINTPEDGLHMIQILSAIYESAETGREVALN